MKDLNCVRIFARAAEMKSFTQAAERLGLTPSAVSKAISRLESELGVRLFSRTTRTVSLTSDGASLLECCKTLLAQLDEAEMALNSSRVPLSGRIRVQMPSGFGKRIVVPALVIFCQKYPDISIDVELTDRLVDLVYEGIDLAIVIGPVSDDQVITRKIFDITMCACASPGYITTHGEPKTPDDLEQHRCLAYIIPPSGHYREWKFQKDGCSFTKKVNGQLNVNNGESLLEAAIAGLGIAMLGTIFAADAIRAGKLKVLLRDYVVPRRPVWATYLPNRNLSPRVRALVKFFQQLIPANSKYELKDLPF